MKVYISAVWGRNANGTGVANYRVREHETEADAQSAVRASELELLSLGFTRDGEYDSPGRDGVSRCVVQVYLSPDGRCRETGYWSQPLQSHGNPGHCEAAYLCRE